MKSAGERPPCGFGDGAVCAHLSRDWLEAAPELAGALYVDGHVRLYHGSQTALPKRYVSRQRLCLRGTTDYGGAESGTGERKAGRGAESGTGPILLNWAAPPTSERSSTGRGILISAHPSRATRGTIGRL